MYKKIALDLRAWHINWRTWVARAFSCHKNESIVFDCENSHDL